jgi:hypothetical protein
MLVSMAISSVITLIAMVSSKKFSFSIFKKSCITTSVIFVTAQLIYFFLN